MDHTPSYVLFNFWAKMPMFYANILYYTVFYHSISVTNGITKTAKDLGKKHISPNLTMYLFKLKGERCCSMVHVFPARWRPLWLHCHLVGTCENSAAILNHGGVWIGLLCVEFVKRQNIGPHYENTVGDRAGIT